MGLLALAFASGVAVSRLGGSLSPPVLLALLLPPVWACRRPGARRWIVVAAAAFLTDAAARATEAACPEPEPGAHVALEGRFLAAAAGGSAPFAREGRCGEVRVVAGPGAPPPGGAVRVAGVWREGRYGGWLLARSVEPMEPSPGVRWATVRWRARLVERLGELYGSRGPLVSALVLARREGLDPEMREAFARSGTAHLLAISGFHVGVIAALGLTLLRSAGLPRRRAAVGAALLAWGYVAFIGFPDAAVRAALILLLVAVPHARGRPPARFGALACALLLFLLYDPGRLAGVGFQLSFAGAAGLVAWAPPVRDGVVGLTRGRCPRALASALGAGVAATAATLPIVAWHFERVSVVGIPATLLASPLVALALPAALATLLIDVVFPPAALFLAGGVDVLLAALEAGVRGAAALPGASVWVPRSWVLLGCAGAGAAWHLAGTSRIRGGVRRGVAAAAAVAAVSAWPLVRTAAEWGTVELVALDVGQGDATLLRTPAGRWVLVDAGPPASGDAGAGPVVSALRRRGVTRLEALVFTHPHLDHFGEGSAVLRSLEVGVVLDPALPTGDDAYVELLAVAGAQGVPWRRVRAGDRWDLDGVTFTALHPDSAHALPGVDPNDASVVLHVAYGTFDALLTGDVPGAVERRLAAGLGGGVEVLKVAHHGSDTSSDSVFVWGAAPELALISVGRGNRYGHPSPDVVARLGRAGVTVVRTDTSGWIRVLARRDGRYEMVVERGR